MPPSVRPYRPDDREAVIAMLAESDPWKTLGYAREDWEKLFAPLPQDREACVVESGGQVLGLAMLRRRVLVGDYLELLVVAAGSRGHGLGGLLLARVEQEVFARTTNLFVCVSDFNEAARRFYRRRGYDEIGPIPNLLVPGSAEILLRKTMGPARG
jgi:ribosomal protein S18 acetylase RimI-like enzyme